MAISIFAPIYCQIKRAAETGPTFSCTVIPAGVRLFEFSLISMIVFEYRLGKHEENHEKSTSLHTFRYNYYSKNIAFKSNVSMSRTLKSDFESNGGLKT